MKILLGILFIIAAVGLLIVMVVIPVLPNTAENATIDDLLARIVCNPGETLIREQYSRASNRGGTSYSANLYCINNENQRRDETVRWVVISAAAFVIPLLLGIFILNLRAFQMRRVVFNTAPGVTVTHFSTSSSGSSPIEGLEINEGGIKFGGMEVRVDSLTPERVQALRQQMQSVVQNNGGDNLAGKLRQLQETRDAGLISGEEYERLRKEVLDNLT